MEAVIEFLKKLASNGVKLSVEAGQLNCYAQKGLLTSDIRDEIARYKSEIVTLLKDKEGFPSSDASRDGVRTELSFEDTEIMDGPVGNPTSKRSSLEPEINVDQLLQRLKEMLAGVLGIKTSIIDVNQAFAELGLESVQGTELVLAINKEYGTELFNTTVFDYPTVRQLALFMEQEVKKLPRYSQATPAVPVFSSVLPAVGSSISLKRKIRGGRAAVLSQVHSESDDRIAIIGMSGRYPQAKNLHEYWENLAAGKNAITEVPASRWDVDQYYDPDPGKKDKTTSKWLGVVDDIDCFDPLFFRISPHEAEYIDPHHRLFLEESYKAFEDAGYSSHSLGNKKCGVYLGISTNEYALLLSKHGVLADAPATSNHSAIAAARIAYYLNSKGPAISVDTACSSSLVAIHLACQGLLSHETDMALAGGVSLWLRPESSVAMSQAGMLSPIGQCKAFDESADGIVVSDGVGALVLKRLKDAEADKDFIYGVILGSGINQDGKTNGITAPSVNSQIELERAVYAKYKIDPGTISYVETHGTGTKLGDPIELEALTTVFKEKTAKKNYCALGSVKSNIGHTISAAGVASMQKVLLSMLHRTLVPSLHVTRENPHFDFKNSPFYISRETQAWDVAPGSLRRASVSSFGFSGTNAHLVVEEYLSPAIVTPLPAHTNFIVPLSARTANQLKQRAQDLLEFIRKWQRCDEATALSKPIDLAALAYTLQAGREGMEERLGLVVESVEELEEKLDAWERGEESIEGVYRGKAKGSGERMGLLEQDEEVKEALVEKWMASRKLGRLAELWVKGLEVEWGKLYGEEKPRRMSLPAYPFAKERYWVDTSAGEHAVVHAVSAELHPLLQRNTSDLSEQRYSTTLTGEEFFLRDHEVAGEKVLPGVAYLEMARAAVEQAGGRPEEAVLKLRNTVWPRAIVVSGKKEVSIGLSAKDDGAIDYEIYSHEGDEEVLHCQGSAEWSEPSAEARVDLERLKARMAAGTLEAEGVYRAYAEMGLVYGATFQGIRRLYRGRGEALAELQLPHTAETGAQEYVLHPSLMDSALQACLGLQEEFSESAREPRLSFALEELRVVSRCEQEMLAWVRYAPGSQAGDAVVKVDIDLCDKQGRVCVELRGFSSRVLKGEEGKALASEEIKAGLQAFVPVWNAVHPKVKSVVGTERVLLVGANATYLEWVQKTHTNVSMLEMPAGATIEVIAGKFKESEFDHLLWVAPDVMRGHAQEDRVIEQQEAGVLALFRMVKALLGLGYGERELRWTIVTSKTQKVKKEEAIRPAHAGMVGLVGSLAKEHPHWKLGLLDVESLESVSAKECLSVVPSQEGNVLAHRGGEWFAQEFAYLPELPQQSAMPYRHKGVYVVIGGAGGLGEVWSRHMIERHQAKVVWIGRRAFDAEMVKKIEELSGLGPAPEYLAADATDLNQLQQACKQILEKHGAIHGVVHSALQLEDQSLAQMEEARFRAGLSAKVDISVNLDRVFGGQELDFMLFFSAIMSFVKAAGQANYAAGCTFKDSYAQSLGQRRRYPVKVMNWGYWGGVGIVAEEAYAKAMERKGIGSIEAAEGMASLETLMNSDLSQMAVIKMLSAQSIVGFPERLSCSSEVSESVLPPASDKVKAVSIERLTATRAELAGMDALLAEMLAASLQSMGQLGDRSLKQQTVAHYERWLQSSIRYLQEQKLLDASGMVSGEVRTLSELWVQWETKKAIWLANPDVAAQIPLLEACVRALPEILRGERQATDVMFPQASMQLVEGVYRGNAQADYFNEVLGETLSACCEETDSQHRLRILEIGAGTGASTAKLLPLLRRLPIDEYCYTDVSRAFLLHAEEHYQPHLPTLKTALFDVAKPLAGQGVAANQYDVVIATNVLHATANIRQTLRNAKAVLKKQGVLLLNEISGWSLFTHLTFGLLEGWWLHEDTELRLSGSPGLAPERWREVLAEEGFEAISFPAEDAHQFGQQVIAAVSDGWVRQPLRQPAVQQPPVVEEEASVNVMAMPTPAATGREETLREKATAYFQKLVGSVLKLRAEQIEPKRALSEYGLDSILVGQLTYQLRKVFSEVTGTLFFEVQSLEGLVEYFLENKRPELVTMLSAHVVAAQEVPAAPIAKAGSIAGVRQHRRSVRTSGLRQKASAATAIAATPGSAIFDVAIIGLSGRYPQAKNVQEFWENLSQGRNCVTEIPADRWEWKQYYDPEKGKAGKIYTRWGGFLEGIDQFDPLFFKISPKEAKRMDPQERIFLECCYHAIEDAGYTPERLGKPEGIGVFVGVMNSRYTPQPLHYSIANRVSYVLNFQGPSMAVDTACSASLTAIHVALESMYSGLSRCAIVGGVNLIIDPVHYLGLAEMTMLSSGNQCRSFGEQADGFIDAEGVGAIVLKPLQQAQADGDHIYAVIKGSAVNAGGKTNGYTVPNPKAQARVVTQALERAKVTAEQLSYIEAHGTGTALGDPIEIAGLTRAFKETSDRKQFCAIGSLKSNIGHCESAAGIAGLTKVLLQFKHGQLVPSLHAEVPNPEIDFLQTPFKVQRRLEPWQRPMREVKGMNQELPRMAGVSSFGAGGANAHVIVEEYLPAISKPTVKLENANSVIVLSAKSAEQLRQKASDLLEWIREEAAADNPIDLSAMAYTLQVGREAMEERLGLVVSSVKQLEEKLVAYVNGEPGIEDLYQGQGKRNQEALALFNTDADLQQTVEKWIASRKLAKLLELWVKGLELDWAKLYGEEKPPRVSLPVYPFARERYWIDPTASGPITANGKAAILHPLLHRNTSDLSEQRYSSTFTGDEFFLVDAPLAANGNSAYKLLPEIACLEMARAAVAQAWPMQQKSKMLEFRHTVWAQPTIFRDTKQVSITLVVNEQESEQVDYEIYSHNAHQEVVQCQGQIVWTHQSAPTRLDVNQLKSQMGHNQIKPDRVYASLARMGFAYGPALQAISALYQGNHQLLAQMSLPSAVAETAGDYVLHPSLMVCALRLVLGLIEGSGDFRQRPLSFSLDSLRLVSPCTPEMFAWVRYTTTENVIKQEIDLCDLRGNICVQVRGDFSPVLDSELNSTCQSTFDSAIGNQFIVKDSSAFDSAFYQKLIADFLNRDLSVEEVIELV